MSFHARQVKQHRVSRVAFHQRSDRRAAEPQDEVTLPVTWNGSVVGLWMSLADHHLWSDKLLAATAPSRTRQAQRSTGTEACRQFASQGATPLNVERPVDGLVRDPHRTIIREVDG